MREGSEEKGSEGKLSSFVFRFGEEEEEEEEEGKREEGKPRRESRGSQIKSSSMKGGSEFIPKVSTATENDAVEEEEEEEVEEEDDDDDDDDCCIVFFRSISSLRLICAIFSIFSSSFAIQYSCIPSAICRARFFSFGVFANKVRVLCSERERRRLERSRVAFLIRRLI